MPVPLSKRPTVKATAAGLKLLIKPWGNVRVDGSDRGPSPPLKNVALAAGRHTLVITNPAFPIPWETTVDVPANQKSPVSITHEFKSE